MNARGFTLLEAMVAMTIVGMVSISTLGAISAAARTSGLASDVLVASELAEERLASLLVLSDEIMADSADGRWYPIGLDGWTWQSTIRPAAGLSLSVLYVEVVGPQSRVEARLLRPAAESAR